MRLRRPEGSRVPVLYAAVRRLHAASVRDRLDAHAHYHDAEVALAATLVATIPAAELAVCQQVADGELHPRALGPEPSPEAIEMAGAALVERAGVRWGPEGWAIVDDVDR